MKSGTAGFEHFQHAVGDDEAAHDIAGGGHHRDESEDGGERALMLAHEHDRAHHRNRIQGIGERHQRSMQQGRNAPDYFKSDETGEHKDKECVD